MINLFNELITQFTTLARAAMTLVAIVAVITTFYKTRSLVATLTTIGVASLALWFVFNPVAGKAKLDEDLGAPAIVLSVPGPVDIGGWSR